MKIRVRLFARLRDAAGCEALPLELPLGACVADVIAATVEAAPALHSLRAHITSAVNGAHARPEVVLAEGDEVALFPPFSGGSDAAPEIVLTRDPIDLRPAPLPDDESGGAVRFLGVVRGSFEGQPVRELAYEAYDEMAHTELRAIADDAAARFGVRGVRIHHRLGTIGVGGAALLVDVVGTHRAEAFAACAAIVDAIKARVPIWKKERLADGDRWI